MPTLSIYKNYMQPNVERFFRECFEGLGWGYYPEGRHADIMNIVGEYMDGGCFWCLLEEGGVIGTVAIRRIGDNVAEVKRLYLLPQYQGNGYGSLLFKTALDYAKANGHTVARLDSRRDRTVMLHLIDKFGFKEIPQYNYNSYAEVFYELDLSCYDGGYV